jgi:hypothetical protein
METKFQSQLTTDNYLEEVGKYANIINELATEKGLTVPLVTLTGTVLSFNDGGKLPDFQKETSKKFDAVDLDNSAKHGPEMIAFMVNNVARYGLISHALYEQIKVGGKDKEILIGAN